MTVSYIQTVILSTFLFHIISAIGVDFNENKLGMGDRNLEGKLLLAITDNFCNLMHEIF